MANPKTIKVAFYIEPLCRYANNAQIDYSLEPIATLIKQLTNSDVKFVFKFICSDVMQARLPQLLPASSDDIITIEEHEMQAATQFGNAESIKHFYRYSLDTKKLHTIASIIKTRLNAHKFTPDIIFTNTTAPHLKISCPDALIVNYNIRENNHPYPSYNSIDFGNNELPGHKLFAAQMLAYEPEFDEYKTIVSGRRSYLDFFKTSISGNNVIKQAKAQYKQVAFLPLGLNTPQTYAQSMFDTQDELLNYVAHNTPKTTAIIVTQHHMAGNFGHQLSYERLNYYADKFSNIIHVEQPSQNIEPHLIAKADYTICINQKHAIQALYLGKPYIGLMQGFSSVISGLTLKDTHNYNFAKHQNSLQQDNALAWLFSHYFMLDNMYNHPGYLTSYLLGMLSKYRKNKKIGFKDLTQLPDATQHLEYFANHTDSYKYNGFIDKVENGIIYGWACNKQDLKKPVMVDIYIDDVHIKSCSAELYRRDIEQALGSAKHGFTFDIDEELAPKLANVRCTISGTDFEIKPVPSVANGVE